MLYLKSQTLDQNIMSTSPLSCYGSLGNFTILSDKKGMSFPKGELASVFYNLALEYNFSLSLPEQNNKHSANNI